MKLLLIVFRLIFFFFFSCRWADEAKGKIYVINEMKNSQLDWVHWKFTHKNKITKNDPRRSVFVMINFVFWFFLFLIDAISVNTPNFIDQTISVKWKFIYFNIFSFILLTNGINYHKIDLYYCCLISFAVANTQIHRHIQPKRIHKCDSFRVKTNESQEI